MSVEDYGQGKLKVRGAHCATSLLVPKSLNRFGVPAFYKVMNKRILCSLISRGTIALSGVAFAASPSTYQVTGPIVAVDDSMITVMKGKEKFEVARDSSTKVTGDLKVGEKVTIMYTMTAKEIEAKRGKRTGERKTTRPRRARALPQEVGIRSKGADGAGAPFLAWPDLSAAAAAHEAAENPAHNLPAHLAARGAHRAFHHAGGHGIVDGAPRPDRRLKDRRSSENRWLRAGFRQSAPGAVRSRRRAGGFGLFRGPRLQFFVGRFPIDRFLVMAGDAPMTG